MKTDTVTCSFYMDRETYNLFKSIVTREGETVKGNLIKYMRSVIQYNNPNADTILAIGEIQKMKADSTVGENYTDVDEIMKELLDV